MCGSECVTVAVCMMSVSVFSVDSECEWVYGSVGVCNPPEGAHHLQSNQERL